MNIANTKINAFISFTLPMKEGTPSKYKLIIFMIVIHLIRLNVFI